MNRRYLNCHRASILIFPFPPFLSQTSLLKYVLLPPRHVAFRAHEGPPPDQRRPQPWKSYLQTALDTELNSTLPSQATRKSQSDKKLGDEYHFPLHIHTLDTNELIDQSDVHVAINSEIIDSLEFPCTVACESLPRR